jgi:arylsulfatase A-like enzyme
MNVLYVTVDSLRADYVFGPHAPESLETLPRLTSEGLTFTNAFADAPHTKQSFLSILSSTYPWMFDSEQVGFERDRPHVAEILSEAGYATAGFHTNTYLSPTYNYDRGFDFYLGRDTRSDDGTTDLAETAYNSLAERALATKGLSDLVHRVYDTAGRHLGVQLGSSLYKPAAELNDAIVDWTRSAEAPVFIWAHYMDVHNPYYPHEGTVSEGISRRRAIRLFHRVNDLRGAASDEDLATLERLYRGEIEYFDRQLGDLLDRLDETLGLEETLVVFTADHGEAFGEHGQVFHPGSALYDENVHVPIILSGPTVDAGEVETPIANVDLVPTILGEVGVDAPPVLAGEHVAEFAADPPEDRLVFTESFSSEDGGMMVTDGRFKLVRDLDTGEQILYDRTAEPKEDHDCSEEHPAVVDRLDAALDEHLRSVTQTGAGTADVEVTEDVRLQLKKLGYDE